MTNSKTPIPTAKFEFSKLAVINTKILLSAYIDLNSQKKAIEQEIASNNIRLSDYDKERVDIQKKESERRKGESTGVFQKRVQEKKEQLNTKYEQLSKDVSIKNNSLQSELIQLNNTANIKVSNTVKDLAKTMSCDLIMYFNEEHSPFLYTNAKIDLTSEATTMLNRSNTTVEDISTRELMSKVVFINIDTLKEKDTIFNQLSKESSPFIQSQKKRLSALEESIDKYKYHLSIHDLSAKNDHKLEDLIAKWHMELDILSKDIRSDPQKIYDDLIERTKITINSLQKSKGFNCILPYDNILFAKNEFEITSDVLRDINNNITTNLTKSIDMFATKIAVVNTDYLRENSTFFGKRNELIIQKRKKLQISFETTNQIIANEYKALCEKAKNRESIDNLMEKYKLDINQQTLLFQSEIEALDSTSKMLFAELDAKIKAILSNLQKVRNYDCVISSTLCEYAHEKLNITNEILTVLDSNK